MSESEVPDESQGQPPPKLDDVEVIAESAQRDGEGAASEDIQSTTSSPPPGDGEDVGRIDARWADDAELPMLKKAIESLVFVSDRIVTHVQLARLVRAKPSQVRQLLGELVQESESRGVQLVEVSGGYQYRTAPESATFVRELVAQKPVRLTRAQLETLALVAYRQPMTRPEVDEVRGVDTGSAIKVLLDRALIKMLGRKDEAGRPMLYGTTPYFLEFFGLKSLKDLPTLKEFTDLSEDSRALFKRKTGESVDQGVSQPSDDAPAAATAEEDWDLVDQDEDFEDGAVGEDHEGEPAEGNAKFSQNSDGRAAGSQGEEPADEVGGETTVPHSND